jgi:hypothetical protein
MTDDQLDEGGIAARRDAALLRALSTPHKRQVDMKLGKPQKAALDGSMPSEPMVVYDVHKSGSIAHYLLDCDGNVASLIAL